MMIYVDTIVDYGAKGKWCHMWHETGDREALDTFAAKIGLKKSWSQLSRGSIGEFYHYDLRPSKRELAVKHGAVEIRLTDWIRRKREEQESK